MHVGFLITAVPYALIGLAGWRNHNLLRRRAAAGRGTPPTAAPPCDVPSRPAPALGKMPFAAEATLAETTLQGALRALDAEAARHLTQLTVAVAPGLVLHADPAALG